MYNITNTLFNKREKSPPQREKSQVRNRKISVKFKNGIDL